MLTHNQEFLVLSCVEQNTPTSIVKRIYEEKYRRFIPKESVRVLLRKLVKSGDVTVRQETEDELLIRIAIENRVKRGSTSNLFSITEKGKERIRLENASMNAKIRHAHNKRNDDTSHRNDVDCIAPVHVDV